MKNKFKITVIFSIIFTFNSFSQIFLKENPLAHTYSIVARDSVTGEMGVAVQSHWFSVGSVVSWGEAGVGVIATQSFTNISFGVRGLELLKEGLSPAEVVEKLLSDDEGKEFRQLAVLDSKGRVAAFTGANCIPEAGHTIGENFSAQANLMLKNTVWEKMSEAFKNNKHKPLAERMISSLEAAESEGGDIRGRQSASLLIVRGESTGKIWEDRLIDLRVEDNDEPVKELKRLLNVHRAYEHMNAGDLAIEKGDMENALKEYSAAEEMFPNNEEMKYWHAVALANNDRIEESFPIFKEVFNKNENWKTLTPRLVPIGLLKVNEEDLKQILSVE